MATGSALGFAGFGGFGSTVRGSRCRRVWMCTSPAAPKAVKICGVASADDARMVLETAHSVLPKDFELLIGMIMWPGSKRCVGRSTASEICSIAREGGARSVGVFVDETASEMSEAQKFVGLDYVQLHGAKSRSQNSDLPEDLPRIFVVDVQKDGSYDLQDPKSADILLFDSKGGGTGRAFDWTKFRAPPKSVRWLLAGGLDDTNAAEAILSLRPWGLDVASGVADAGGVRKDPARVARFLRAVSSTAATN